MTKKGESKVSRTFYSLSSRRANYTSPFAIALKSFSPVPPPIFVLLLFLHACMHACMRLQPTYLRFRPLRVPTRIKKVAAATTVRSARVPCSLPLRLRRPSLKREERLLRKRNDRRNLWICLLGMKERRGCRRSRCLGDEEAFFSERAE